MINYIDSKNEMPTAFFTANDAIASGVIKGLYERNIRVPEDISIIGFNDTIISQYTHPPLTAIRVHIEYLGEVAVELMMEKLKGRQYAKKVIIPSDFILRNSVKDVKQLILINKLEIKIVTIIFIIVTIFFYYKLIT